MQMGTHDDPNHSDQAKRQNHLIVLKFDYWSREFVTRSSGALSTLGLEHLDSKKEKTDSSDTLTHILPEYNVNKPLRANEAT